MTNHHDGEPPSLYAVPPPEDDYDATHTAPNNIDAERAVLGAILAHPETLHEVTATLEPEDFYRPAHEVIYHAAATLYATGQPVTLISVHEQLQATRDLRRAGGGPYLHDLIMAAPAAPTVTYNAQLITAKAQQRRLITAGQRIAQIGYADGTDPDTALAAATAALHAATPAVSTATASTWQPVDLTDILNGQDLDDHPPTILARTDGPCLLYPGAVHSIAGEPESGKSWVALHATAQQLAAGRNVLYIDFEDRPDRVVNRLLTIGAHPDRIRHHFRYVRPEQALSPATTPHLTAAAADTTLAVIDGITEAMTLHGLSLLDNEDVARWLALMPRRLADQGPAVLQIDHVIKNSEQRGRYAIGGQHKLAGIDGCAYKITVTDPFGRGKKGHARITLDKDREGHVRAIALGHTVATLTLDGRDTDRHTADQLRVYLDPPTADIGPDGGGFRPTVLMEKVSRYVEINPGCTGRGITDTVKGKRTAVLDAIRALTAEGYVRTEPGAKNAVQHWSERPFREDADS